MTAHQYPDSHVFYRKLYRDYPLITRAEGCWLIDEDGKRYLDGSGGAFVANIGHGVREIGRRWRSRPRRSPISTAPRSPASRSKSWRRSWQRSLPAISIRSTSSPAAPRRSRPRSSWLGNTGWKPASRPSTRLSRCSPRYHGNTLLALSASAREHYKVLYREWLVDVVRIPAPYSYRCECGGTED